MKDKKTTDMRRVVGYPSQRVYNELQKDIAKGMKMSEIISEALELKYPAKEKSRLFIEK